MSSVEEEEEELELEENQPHPHNVSRLSVCTTVESESFDADAEFSDSENDVESCYSLPCTPPQRRRIQAKEYASDNGEQKGDPAPRRRRRSLRSDRWRLELERLEKEKEKENGPGIGLGGESGVMVISRPKGSNRALCMDLEEVKACRDLGFELEHERIVETSSGSGSNSPIATWPISSPGDDPRDVKARLKVWAQAVAIVSTTNHR
ncbi:hypothetical protein Fmac_006832 [Flemingia macrophylla]|uniref:Fold protein n=1 Tax=Flemingia macrophylla TaxID=520843 RepID=A0ABD1NBP8_9FABA